MNKFLDRGGCVEEIPRGISGRDANQSMMPPSRSLFIEPTTPRTPIPEVVAAIEARRASKPKPATRPKRAQRYRKTLYDDFGEPLRKVWVDE